MLVGRQFMRMLGVAVGVGRALIIVSREGSGKVRGICLVQGC